MSTATRPQRLRPWRCTLAAVTLAAAFAMPGCSRAPQERVVRLRVADLLHGAATGAGGQGLLTHDYPRFALAGQTRTVIAHPDDLAQGFAQVHASFETQLPASATMDLAYGLLPRASARGLVRFNVTVGGAARSEVVLDRTLASDDVDSGRWHDARIDLSAWAGAVSIDFTTSFELPDDAGEFTADPPLGIFSAPVISTPRTREAPKPHNLIVVSLDTLRADHLGVYGYPRQTSPFIDEYFSTKGIIVDRAYTQGADTLFGHTAMLYGADPCVALMRLENRGGAIAQPWGHVPNVPSLAELLRQAGYRTAAYTEDAMLAAEWGFARGFEIYDEEKNTDHGRLLSGYVRQTFDRGLAWLDANRDSTFFLFLHTYQVHNPYDPPEKYGRPFRDPDRTDQPGIDIDGYDGEIRYTDAELRRLVDALTRRGILDDTVLVVTSDHGEEFNEHGGRFHSSQVYEEILHVPLLVRAPGLLPEGARRAGPVLLLDLPRTLLDLLGVPVHTVFDGISVREHLAEAAPLPTRRFTAVANGELRFTYAGLDPSWLPPTYAAVQFPWKLIRKNTRDGPAYELYDVVADPGETRNRYDEVTDVAAALRAMLQRHDGECRSRQAKLLREWGRPVGNATAVGDDAERLQKLKALGYLE